jgi:hypothetical protein
MPLAVTEIRRQAFLNSNASTQNNKVETSKLVQNSTFKRRRTTIKTNAAPGMKRLIRFLELLKDYDAAPWANKVGLFRLVKAQFGS